MEPEVANSISSLHSHSPSMLFRSSTSFTIQHSVNMHNIIADPKIHKRRKQTALPRKKIYIEREKLRHMEISAPMPNLAFQVPRLRQTNEMQANTNSGYQMRESPKQNANKTELRPKQLTLNKVQEQEANLAVRLFQDCVLPELKAHLPLPKTTTEDVLNFELQPSVSDNQCTYANIYAIPPAAQTWHRSDCLMECKEEGLVDEIMQEIHTRSVTATYITAGSNKTKITKDQMNLEHNGSVAALELQD